MIGTEDLALLVWLTFIAVGVVCIYLLSTAGDGAVLTIQGSAIGHGLCNLTVQADLIAANVSLATNSTSWNIVAGGMA
ncbi:MAG: hypothetical protein WC261_08055 [Synergistaceae bacterium]|jgi:hypothetical protein